MDQHSLQAADVMRREVSAEASEDIQKVLSRSAWRASRPAVTFKILCGGREVDQSGNVVDAEARSRGREPHIYYGERGLVEAWDVIEAMNRKAATLGVELKITIKYAVDMTARKDWAVFHPKAVG
jgi:hypothetical protein